MLDEGLPDLWSLAVPEELVALEQGGKLHQPFTNRLGHRTSISVHVQLGVDSAQVIDHRVWADVEDVGDFLVH